MSEFDAVSHPSHYTEGREYEPRKVIMDWGLDFYLGNTVKYISRAGRKNDALEDLKKAKQYLEWEIEMIEEKNKKELDDLVMQDETHNDLFLRFWHGDGTHTDVTKGEYYER